MPANEVARRYAEGLGDVVTRAGCARRASRRCGRNTRSGSSRRSARCACRGAEGAKAFRPRSITRSRCTGCRPTDSFRSVDNGIPVSDRLAEEVISLPMHAYLDAATQDRIIDATRRALKK